MYISDGGFLFSIEGKGVEKFTLRENICLFPTVVFPALEGKGSFRPCRENICIFPTPFFSSLEGKGVEKFTLGENIFIFPTVVFSALEGKEVGQFSPRENIGIVAKVFLCFRKKRSRAVYSEGKLLYDFTKTDRIRILKRIIFMSFS